MSAPLVVYLALTGLAVGSFLNLAIDRLPLNKSILSPPSHCDHCQRRILPLDLVPLFSYLWLRGKCRFCRAYIPWRTAVVEGSTGILFGLIAYLTGPTLTTLVTLVLTSVFIVIIFIDLEHQLILNKVVLPGAVVALLIFPFGPAVDGFGLGEAVVRSIGGGSLGFITILVIYLLSRGGMGEGDVKLAALAGFATGFPQIMITLLMSFISGGAVAILLLALRRKGCKDVMPFGPFFAGSAIATLLAGKEILDWYLGILP